MSLRRVDVVRCLLACFLVERVKADMSKAPWRFGGAERGNLKCVPCNRARVPYELLLALSLQNEYLIMSYTDGGLFSTTSPEKKIRTALLQIQNETKGRGENLILLIRARYQFLIF